MNKDKSKNLKLRVVTKNKGKDQKNFYSKNIKWLEDKTKQIQQKQEDLKEKELSKCSFQPNIERPARNIKIDQDKHFVPVRNVCKTYSEIYEKRMTSQVVKREASLTDRESHKTIEQERSHGTLQSSIKLIGKSDVKDQIRN